MENDLISRQAAEKAVSEGLKQVFVEHETAGKNLLSKVPSAQPEQKRGKWERWVDRVEHSRGVEYIPRCRCSECETEYDPHTASFINFCPNCGADMRGE